MDNNNNKVLVVCTTDSMITNFLIPHIRDLKNRGCQVDCACAQTGDFINIIRNNGIQVHKVDFHRNPFSFGNVKAFRQLCRLIKTERYNVIFCHEPVGGAMGRIVGHMYNCKVIYMAHGFHFFKGAPKKNRLFYYVEKFLSRWTDVLVTINQEDYDASKQFSCKNLVKLNGIGVDTTRFCYEPNRDYIKKIVGDENVVLLSVGELIPRKNHEVVIKAIASLNDKSIHYLVAGEGELMSYLTNLATRLAICDHITKKLSVFMTDATSSSKSYLGCALESHPMVSWIVDSACSFLYALSNALFFDGCWLPDHRIVVSRRISNNTPIIIEGYDLAPT